MLTWDFDIIEFLPAVGSKTKLTPQQIAEIETEKGVTLEPRKAYKGLHWYLLRPRPSNESRVA